MFVFDLRKWLCVAVAFAICSTTIHASTTNTNYDPKTVFGDTLLMEEGPSRYYFSLSDTRQTYTICGLQPGKTYDFFVGSNQQNADAQPDLALPGQSAQSAQMSLQARATCEDVVLLSNVMDPLAVRFSMGCQNGEKSEFLRGSFGLAVDQNYTPQQLVQDVFIGGDCFDVNSSSIQFSGNASARGYFSSGGSSIQIEEGVVLSTGNILNIEGENSAYNRGNSFNSISNDPDIKAITPGTSSTYDASALEFDFTPTSDTVQFEFVFASEEYCEYVGSNFNDAFGFFISGPGINGGFSGGAENIAQIPGSSEYVTINNLNHNLNSQYYVDNIPSAQLDAMPFWLDCDNYASNNGPYISLIEFDGFTTRLTAMAEVQACETYHIKLIVADVNDGFFDSAVFLKANSFTSGETAIVSPEVPGIADNKAYENCQGGYFVFERSNDDLSTDLEIPFTVSPLSTAQAGVDYGNLPSSITIPAGDSVFYLFIDVYPDNLIEGEETILLELEAPCSCGIPYAELILDDSKDISVSVDDQTFCTPEEAILTPTVTGGILSYTYFWSTADTTSALTVLPDETTTYTVTVTDFCGNTAEESVTVNIVGAPRAEISGYAAICPGTSAAQLTVTFEGTGPWDFAYTIDGGTPIMMTNIQENPYLLPVDAVGLYQLVSVEANGCTGPVQGAGTIIETEINLEAMIEEVSCPGANSGSLVPTIAGGTAPYTYTWSNGSSAEWIENLDTGLYTLIVTDVLGCTVSESWGVPLSPNVPTVDAGLPQMITCATPTVLLQGSGSVGPSFLSQWETTNGHILSGENTFNPEVNGLGIYSLTITHLPSQCALTSDVFVDIDTMSPQAYITPIGPQMLDCQNTSSVLDGTGSQPAGQLSYEWTTNIGTIGSGQAQSPVIEVFSEGIYALTVQNTTNGCTASTQFEINIDVDLPSVSIASPDIINCSFPTRIIDADGSSVGSSFVYQWTTDDGAIINGSNTLNPEVAGAGNYQLVITNQLNGCADSASVAVLVDTIHPVATIVRPDILDCSTPEVVLDGSGSSTGNDFVYVWNTGGGVVVDGERTAIATVSAAAFYSLQVTNETNGCSTETSIEVFENTNRPVSANWEAEPPICQGDPTFFSLTGVTGGEGPYLYSYDGGETFTDVDTRDDLFPGNFSLIVQDVNGCELTVPVAIPDALPLLITTEDVITVKLGESEQLDFESTIPNYLISSIVWTPDETLDCGDCRTPIVYPLDDGVYTVMVTDVNGCTASDSTLIQVRKDRSVFIPNAFSPNLDGYNDFFYVQSDASVSKVNRLAVFDRWGAALFETQNILPNEERVGWDGSFKGEYLTPGVFIYFAEIEFVDGAIKLFKGDVTITKSR